MTTTLVSQKSKINFDEALTNYYKLKHEYEKAKQKEITKLISNKILSDTEKRKKFVDFKKKCINCGKYGGNIFKQENNILIAHCDSDHPCKLNIQLQKAKYNNITKEITDSAILVNDNKIAIIRAKLNFLFGFINEPTTVTLFNQLKTDLIKKVKSYQNLNEKYMNIINNVSKKNEIKKQNESLFLLIQEFKDFIKEFNETGETKFLKDAVELYIQSIQKLASDIRKLNYVYNTVEYNEVDNTSHLIQEQYTPSDLQVIIPGTENKIIAYSI